MKGFFNRSSLAGLCAALLSVVGIAETKQLRQVQAEQGAKYGVDRRSLSEVQEQKTSNRFTQTTAHLQTKFVIDVMKKESSSRYIPYLNIIFDCLVKEQDLKNSHYVFYHTTANEYRLAHDVYNRLYTLKHPNQRIEDFVSLRFTELKQFGQQSPRDFLLNELKEHGIVNNDRGDLGGLLLSVNLSLFGNIDWPSSSSWDYFLNKGLDQRIPTRKDYEAMMTEFGLTHTYIEELMSLTKIYDTDQNTLLQIFIPQNKVDQIGYLAWSLGMPKHDKSIAWVNKHIKKTSGSIGSGADRKNALMDLAKQFKKNQEDPLFKDLIESAKTGDFSLNAFLKGYCNTPWKIEDLDHAQARLIFTPNGLLNPAADIQFYRYSTASPEQLRAYSKRLNEIMNKIFAESKK
jgi:hypothetical protein